MNIVKRDLNKDSRRLIIHYNIVDKRYEMLYQRYLNSDELDYTLIITKTDFIGISEIIAHETNDLKRLTKIYDYLLRFYYKSEMVSYVSQELQKIKGNNHD